MKNNGLFSTLFIEDVRQKIDLDDLAQGRMATLAQIWRTSGEKPVESLWDSFMKQALGSLQFAPANSPKAPGHYLLYEDWGFSNCIAIVYLIEVGADISDTSVGRFWPAKLIVKLKKRNLNWGILTDGATWRLYSTKSSRPYEDFVELPLAEALESDDQSEYGLFERFFHKDSFVPEEAEEGADEAEDEAAGVYKCRLDRDKEVSEKTLDKQVNTPLLLQVDETLQYLCNGFISDTPRRGDEYTEDERKEIFESSVKLLYRCLFFFYAEARRLLPSEADKAETYEEHSIRALCQEAHKFQWGKRKDTEGYDLWQHLKGLTNAVNEGDPEYGIMGYNGGLFDDEEEVFLGEHKLRNDFLARALYLLAYVEPYDGDPDKEYEIPYEDLEVRHLGELYEDILECTVLLADADRIRRRTKKGVEMLLASETTKQKGDTVIKKGDVYFGESALERKQTGSYYTAESLVRFLNSKAVIEPLREKFEKGYRKRFDEFLEQARSGYDNATKRGAGRSAVALVERFVNEVILDFKVCDSAMGSGHFLVDASNQMSGLVLEILAEIPDMQGLNTNVTSDPNHWRRLITRHCLFGVDLNPLAVDLAKLSLWLNCFAINHKLTFLDHRLRCGNSLIGLRTLDQLKTIPKRKKDKKQKTKQLVLPNFDDLSKTLADVAQAANTITEIDEDDTDRQKETFDEAHRTTEERLAPLADLFTGYLMDEEITENDYRLLFDHFAKGGRTSQISNPNLKEVWESVEYYKDQHHFFHWALKFPDVFGPGGKGGLNATIGNPPWDILKPNSQEFFSAYDPNFRRYKKQEASRVARRLMEDNEAIREHWEQSCKFFVEQSVYVREPDAYEALGKGDINTFKLFLERFFALLRNHGRMGIVVPSGIYTDQGCQPLREMFFSTSQIGFLYGFENRWPTVFSAVDGRFKFVVFSTEKGGTTDEFRCAFMEHDPERLPAIDASALKVSIKQVKTFSPDTLSVMEFKSQRDIDIASIIYGDWPLLGEKLEDAWNVKFNTELHMTNDSHLFVDPEDVSNIHEYVWLWEGKQIWLLSDGFAEHIRLVAKEDIIDLGSVRYTRVAYRTLAASTNERTLVATVIPPHPPVGHSINVCPLEPEKCCFLAAVMTSFVVDWVIRNKVTTNITMFYLYQLPIPRSTVNEAITESIIARGARLISGDEQFTPLWNNVFTSDWQSPTFWYPEASPIDNYGPTHEQEIRSRLRDDAKNLTREWALHCGVHNRTRDRRDTGDRAQLRAEIDAYVAHLYGLSRDDFSYILDTFPVLKRKEEAAFGEFMSKRKCLEEYDRIGSIL